MVLASRSGPGAGGVGAVVAGLAGLGSAVAVVACDVGDRGQVGGLLGWIGGSGPGLSVVVHAAVGVELEPVGEIGAGSLAGGLAAKVGGAVVLDELTAGLDLRAFVLVSSIAGVWGSGSHGVYAAANAFLDALAARRRARGLVATSVAWGVWEAGWTGGSGGLAGGLRRQGLRFLDPGRALSALGEVLADDETFVVVADVDWARFGPAFTARRPSPLIGDLPEVARALAAGAGGGGGVAGGGLAGRLAGLAGAGRVRVVTDVVRAEAAAVLGHASAGAVEPGRAFRDLGFDSLTAVELRDRLNAVSGLGLPATVVFDFPSAAALAGEMVRLLAGAAEPAGGPVTTRAGVVAGEPVAVVSVGCRYPGGGSPEELWGLLAAGGDAVSGLPGDRGWDLGGLFDPDPDREGTSYAREGGFVAGAGGFDAGFFGISPREALAMDPQQRLLLEVCWEAVERAGIDPAGLRGSSTGVFAGAAWSGYGGGLADAEGHLVTGGVTAVISGRVSYALGLEGPAVTVDTACSSALVAVHLACQALRAGECDLALAGGVAVMVTPAGLVGFSRQRALAADGRCKAFGAGADGMGLGEGAGVVLLERLSDARASGHRVLAVVAGSAVNQDGASNGLAAPNGPSQQRVIAAALASAGLAPGDVDAVEGHGTGTTLGDPIEAQALIAAYGQGRAPGRPLWLGSVKSNIGHAQAAAGAAGLIKMVLALEHGVLPATLHAGQPSPHVDWSAGQVRLLTGPVPWPAGQGPRRAGISAFGISGTNAHLIIEDPPAPPPPAAGDGPPDTAPGDAGAREAGRVLAGGPLAWLVSARTPAALAAQAARLAARLDAAPQPSEASLAWSLATTRTSFEHRAVVTGTSRGDLAAGLAALAAGQPAPGVVTGTAPPGGPGPVVFVFPGQGSQWPGMGQELAAASPVFAARLAQCAAALAPHTGWDLHQVLAQASGAPALEGADVIQPALWAVMVSLAATWQAAGITPAAVAGHSQGEIAAATVAGILTLPDAAAVVARRSQALAALAGHGGMLSAAAPASQLAAQITAWGSRLSVAAINGPAATVISGDQAALAELAAACQAAGIATRTLPVDYASHSPHVEPLRGQILTALASITPQPAALPMISAMTGQILTGPDAGPSYWYDSLRAPVDFHHAITTLAAAGHHAYIEISPHPVLTAAITATLETTTPPHTPTLVTATLHRDNPAPHQLTTALATAHTHGLPITWTTILPPAPTTPLPTYPFQHHHYWPPTPPPHNPTAAGLAEIRHPLLGVTMTLAAGDGLVLIGRLSLQSQPWLADHAVTGTVLLPGTAFVEMAVLAGDAAGCGRIQELTLEAPLVLPADHAVYLQVSVGGPGEDGQRALEVHARTEDTGQHGPWVRHASGLLAPAVPAEPGPAGEFTVWPPAGATPVDVSGLYETMSAGGYGYGPAFRGLRAAWRRGQDIFAEVALPDHDAAADFGLHPALFDAALHVSALAELSAAPGAILLPFVWTGVSLHAAGAAALRVQMRAEPAGGLTLAAADGTGAPVISVDSLVLRPVTEGQLDSGDGHDALFAVGWTPVTGADGRAEAGPWAVTGTDHDAIATALTAAGTPVRAYPDLAALVAAVQSGDPAPAVVVARSAAAAGPDHAGGGAQARQETGRVLGLVQDWLECEPLASARLVLATAGAIAASAGEGVSDLAGAAVWGLVRSAQSENPGRIVLADLPAGPGSGHPDALGALPGALAAGEPELVIRDGIAYGRRLVRPAGALARPAGDGPWRLEAGEEGTLDGLALVACPEAGGPLGAGQVRVAVRAAGLNFRDVLIGLGMYPGGGVLGSEIAGVVTETGPGVSALTAGDRVMGMASAGFGPVVVADARVLARVPAGWSFARAASVPVAFLTAWYALVDLAGVRAG
ncbi:MAG TPA: beta-ketoacyl synthase N-terminal-like domain-containing protein, partial [Streptosporangiaceae bacterium]